MAECGFGADGAVVPAASEGQAFFEFGVMYAGGRGVPPDLVAAHKWFNIAAARGYAQAAARRAELAFEMSSAEIALAQREARTWLASH